MNYAGLIYDDSRHYLDHLAPFCAQMGWPLITCESVIGDLARKYYPDLEVIEKNFLELKLPPYLVACDTHPLIQAAFPNQKFQTFWLPHGNSDKGWNSPFFEALKNEGTALVYGQKMIDFMHAKKAFPQIIRIGNFRWRYFCKHAQFYQEIIDLPEGKNFLYAPTWDDSENNCSFWSSFPHLAKALPNSCNLLVKLHPNTYRKFEVEIEMLMGRYAKKPNIFFLPEIPPIYPLLNRCDAYIGDLSSIGYDFLKFDKPMYFLNARQQLPLHRCGKVISAETFSFEEEGLFSSIRKQTYDYTFDPDRDWIQIQDQIHAFSCV